MFKKLRRDWEIKMHCSTAFLLFLSISGVLSMTSAESPLRFSCHTLDKATKAKVTLESYYCNLITQHKERRQRLQRLEESLQENGLPDGAKAEKRQKHAEKETEFLRLKRSRLGVDDFEALKVIGKGAFGEVRINRHISGQWIMVH